LAGVDAATKADHLQDMLAITGQARRVKGKWLLSFAEFGSPALFG
jgi:hypothetical protein